MAIKQFTVDFDKCDHANSDFDSADPAVGLFGDYWLCNDCGAWADDFHLEHNADEDGYCGSTVVPHWWAPADDDDDDDECEDGLSDMDADAMTLASAGYGTDEDYGYYGD